jgi:hypothetical protein
MANVQSTRTFAVGPAGTSQPDSLTMTPGGSLWVEYGNGVASDGTGGSSTVVQYGAQGQVLHSYTIAGEADGLKLDPTTGDVWVMQNQDGNSTLTRIDPSTGQVSAPLSYAVASSTRGYDDVAFDKGRVFVSHTNPVANGDAVVQMLTNGNDPFGSLQTTNILSLGDTGTNLVTGQTNQVLPITDPDSLKALSDGTLVLTGEKDSSIILIHAPGTAAQSESFLNLPAGVTGPDDVITTAGATSGTFFVSQTGTNQVTEARVTNLNPHDLYASVSSENAVVQIDPTTGAVTPVVTGLSSPHGLLFVPAGGSMPSTDTARTAASPLVAQGGSSGGSSGGSFGGSSLSSIVQALAGDLARDLTGGTGGGAFLPGSNGLAQLSQQFASFLGQQPQGQMSLAALLPHNSGA